MGEIKFDQDAVASICRQLNTVKSGIGRESNRVNSVHTVLWADQALTNAFSASLITEIKTAARKLDKQKELLVQYHAQVQSIAEAFPDADHHRGPINRILTSLLSTYFVSNTGLFGIAVLGLMGEKTDSSSASVSGTDETGECVSLYDWIFGKRKNNKTITVEAKKDYDVQGTYEKKVAAEKAAYAKMVKEQYRFDWENCGFEDVTDDFLIKVYEISKELGASPDDLMAIMAFESGVNHTTVNRYSGATGLIQFMPDTAAGLGTSTEELKTMSALDQLDYVKKYFQNSGINDNASDLGDLYMAVLWPRAIGKPDDYVLFSSGSIQYDQNSGLDFNGDGMITKAEAVRLVLNNRKAYVGA